MPTCEESTFPQTTIFDFSIDLSAAATDKLCRMIVVLMSYACCNFRNSTRPRRRQSNYLQNTGKWRHR